MSKEALVVASKAYEASVEQRIAALEAARGKPMSEAEASADIAGQMGALAAAQQRAEKAAAEAGARMAIVERAEAALRAAEDRLEEERAKMREARAGDLGDLPGSTRGSLGIIGYGDSMRRPPPGRRRSTRAWCRRWASAWARRRSGRRR